jgi:hypothetical protein
VVVVKRMKDDNTLKNPFDSDYKSKKEKLTRKRLLFIFIIGSIIGYGVSFSIADETIKYEIYNRNMKKINDLEYNIQPFTNITKVFYIKNLSPTPASFTIKISDEKRLDYNVYIEKEKLQENDITYVELKIISNRNKHVLNIRVIIEGEY